MRRSFSWCDTEERARDSSLQECPCKGAAVRERQRAPVVNTVKNWRFVTFLLLRNRDISPLVIQQTCIVQARGCLKTRLCDYEKEEKGQIKAAGRNEGYKKAGVVVVALQWSSEPKNAPDCAELRAESEQEGERTSSKRSPLRAKGQEESWQRLSGDSDSTLLHCLPAPHTGNVLYSSPLLSAQNQLPSACRRNWSRLEKKEGRRWLP